jgi:hypothetical protein
VRIAKYNRTYVYESTCAALLHQSPRKSRPHWHANSMQKCRYQLSPSPLNPRRLSIPSYPVLLAQFSLLYPTFLSYPIFGSASLFISHSVLYSSSSLNYSGFVSTILFIYAFHYKFTFISFCCTLVNSRQ